MVSGNALALALGCALAGAPMLVSIPAWAAETPAGAEARRHYAVPAGKLADVLARFAAAAGVPLSFDPRLLDGLTSPGLQGEFTVREGFAQLLAGSGHMAVDIGEGRYALQRVSADGAMTLDPVTVEGSAVAPASVYDAVRTEGSKSYTATATTVGKTATAIKDIPQSVSVVTREMMDDRNVTSLSSAMRNTTGMRVYQYDGAGIFNDIKARGYVIESVQLDGVATTQRSGNFATSFDAAIYDRMEVLRGPSGLYQSGGEPGGTINLARKRALDHLSFGGAAGIGSWDSYRAEADASTPLVESGKIRGRVVAVMDDRGSFQDVVETQKMTGYATLEADLSASTTLSIGAAEQTVDSVLNHGVPGFSDGRTLDIGRSAFLGADWNYLDTDSSDQFVELQHRLDNGATAQLSARHLYRTLDYGGIRVNNTINPVTNMVDMIAIITKNDLDEWSTDGHVATPVEVGGLTHTLLVGADYRTSRSDGNWGTAATPSINVYSFSHSIARPNIVLNNPTRTDIEQYGAYSQARVKAGVDWLTLVAGGRMSWWNTEVTNRATNQVTSRYSTRGEFTPYGGVVVDATKEVAVYASYTEIFKPQSVMDASGNIIKPRIGGAYETGIKGSFLEGRLNTHLAAYHMVDENRAVAIPGCVGTNCNEAAGKVRSRGIEAQVTGTPLPQWDVSAGYAYVMTDHLEGTAANKGNTFAPETPKHSANLWAKYTFGEGMLDGLSLGGGVNYSSDTYGQSAAGTRWVQDAYAVVNALIGYEINENLSASLNINNIFDKTYYDRVTSNYTNYYGEPRSAMLTLRAKW